MVDKNTIKRSKSELNRRTNLNADSQGIFEDVKIDTKIKLSIMWVALMFLYAYNDILSFFQPGTVNDLATGAIEGIHFTPMLLLGSAILMSIPVIMILLSLSLRARTNRRANIGVGIFHLILLVGTTLAPGETWAFYAYNMMGEGLIIILIVITAWTWPMLNQSRGGD